MITLSVKCKHFWAASAYIILVQSPFNVYWQNKTWQKLECTMPLTLFIQTSYLYHLKHTPCPSMQTHFLLSRVGNGSLTELSLLITSDVSLEIITMKSKNWHHLYQEMWINILIDKLYIYQMNWRCLFVRYESGWMNSVSTFVLIA